MMILHLVSCNTEEMISCAENLKFKQMSSENRDMVYACYRMNTSEGDIDMAINQDKAPIHAENFDYYVNIGHYEGTVFHRVIRNFMIQGGGYYIDENDVLQERLDGLLDGIELETDNGLRNKRCTVAAARINDPNSAKSQFYINVINNPNLDPSPRTDFPGYTVFGHVVNGMNIIDYIRTIPTSARDGFTSDVPLIDITINSVDPMECDDFF